MLISSLPDSGIQDATKQELPEQIRVFPVDAGNTGRAATSLDGLGSIVYLMIFPGQPETEPEFRKLAGFR